MSPSSSRRLRLGRLESLAAVAGGVTHELSNLAASVLMSVQLLEAYCGDAPGRELLASLDQLARRLQHAGRQLHWLARGVDGESMVFQPQYLLADLQKLARAAFPSSVTLVTRYPPDLWPLAGDPLIAFQLLLALCLEARDHLQGGGTLVLTARNEARLSGTHEARYVVLEAAAEPAAAGDRAAAARRRRAAAEARRAAAAAGGFTTPIPRRPSVSGRRAYLPAASFDPTP